MDCLDKMEHPIDILYDQLWKELPRGRMFINSVVISSTGDR
jgi:hypothetical protein